MIGRVRADTANVVVVGAGLFGTSIAFQLARRGAHVRLVEQSTVCAGDSGVSFSLVRRHYSNEVTARLAVRGVETIKHWAEEVGTGASGYVRTGYLLTVGADQRDALAENVGLLRSWGVDTRLVAPEEIAELEPLLSVEGIAAAAYEPDGGFADAEKMTLAWFAAAVRAGAEPLLATRVTALGERRIETEAGLLEADAVVLATGAWARELVDVPVSLRRVQGVVIRQAAGRPQLGISFSDAVTNVVLRPDQDGTALCVAYQPDERLESRRDCREELDPGYEQAVRAALRERVPAYGDAAVVRGFAGAYDYTPDWNPVLGWAPGLDSVYLALGWSGHGFKLAPSVGEVVATEVLGETPPVDVTDLRPERFAQGRLLRLAYGPGARA